MARCRWSRPAGRPGRRQGASSGAVFETGPPKYDSPVPPVQGARGAERRRVAADDAVDAGVGCHETKLVGRVRARAQDAGDDGGAAVRYGLRQGRHAEGGCDRDRQRRLPDIRAVGNGRKAEGVGPCRRRRRDGDVGGERLGARRRDRCPARRRDADPACGCRRRRGRCDLSRRSATSAVNDVSIKVDDLTAERRPAVHGDPARRPRDHRLVAPQRRVAVEA